MLEALPEREWDEESAHRDPRGEPPMSEYPDGGTADSMGSVSAAHPMLCLKKVSKQYGAVWSVREVSLELGRGEALILLGPSGSGKTTILKMLAGLEIPTEGEIWVNGREMSEVPPHRRGLGMVFQNYALFPACAQPD